MQELEFRNSVLSSSRLRILANVPLALCSFEKQSYDTLIHLLDLTGRMFANLVPAEPVVATPVTPPPLSTIVPTPTSPPLYQGSPETQESMSHTRFFSIASSHPAESFASSIRTGNTVFYSVCDWDSDDDSGRSSRFSAAKLSQLAKSQVKVPEAKKSAEAPLNVSVPLSENSRCISFTVR